MANGLEVDSDGLRAAAAGLIGIYDFPVGSDPADRSR